MSVVVNQTEFARLTRPVVTYGCVLCQAYHTEGDDLYATHLHRQAKHTYSDRPPTPAEVFHRLAKAQG